MSDHLKVKSVSSLMLWWKYESIKLDGKNKMSKDVKIKKRGKQQGPIQVYPSRVRVGRGSVGEGHEGIWARAVCSKSSTPKK